ncbi:MAG: type II CRISPR RNA-guided endonuclease Cas9 [Candidatus Puniceispirillaceae bacterium]
MRDRYKERMRLLMNRLVASELMPSDVSARKEIEQYDPYPLRKSALDMQIAPYEVGRAIYHIAQRRGFKSNRKTDGGEDGTIRKSVKQFQEKLEHLGMRTVGEYLASQHESRKPVRARRLWHKKDDLFEMLPNQKMVEDEFDNIWEKQASFTPDFYDDQKKAYIKDVNFHQRPLKPVKPGKCQFCPNEPRIARAHPLFQKFRIYQEVNNLSWRDDRLKETKILQHLAARNCIISDLLKKKTVTFKAIQKTLQKLNIIEDNVSFNLQDEKRKELAGDETAYVMSRKVDAEENPSIGQKWHAMAFEQQCQFID